MRTLLILAATVSLQAQPSTRELNDIGWMEFKTWVPEKIQTVLLTTGTLEPHGVANNGADNTAPLAIARDIARGVNAMIAPEVNYGMTGSLDAYPGAMCSKGWPGRASRTSLSTGTAVRRRRCSTT